MKSKIDLKIFLFENNRTRLISVFLFLLSVISFQLSTLNSQCLAAVRLKDLARVEGVRDNQLIGYGLVVGLNGTGDSASTSFTFQSIVSMLENMGITVSKDEISVSNVAAVVVTANLPPFVQPGNKIDVTVSSIGNASDLQGGTLLMTPLKAANGNVYAVAQGALSIGGFNAGAAGGGAASIQKNHPTVARIPGGALIEREVPTTYIHNNKLRILLRSPDFTTVDRIRKVINENLRADSARAVDAGTVEITVPEEYQENVISFISQLEALTVEPDSIAKIVINERTGTIVAGEKVRISTIAVSHGNLSIEIKAQYIVSQPTAFSTTGNTTVVPDTQAYVEEEESRLMVIKEGVDIGEVAAALNALGVTPRDMISIFQAMKEAGALQAELVLM